MKLILLGRDNQFVLILALMVYPDQKGRDAQIPASLPFVIHKVIGEVI